MSHVLINTEPQGAEVYVDGTYVGQAPVQYGDNAIVGTSHRVEVRMEGYHPTYAEFRRSGNVNAGALIGGFCCWPIWLWVVDYPPVLLYRLRPLDARSDARDAPAGAAPGDRPGVSEPESEEEWVPPPPPPPETDRGAAGGAPDAGAEREEPAPL